MKRFLAALLILAMLLPAAAALADLPDISGLTNEELIELNKEIQSILFSRQLVDGVTIPQGTYIIGEDIPAGSYRVEITGGTGYYDLRSEPGGRLLGTGVTGAFYNVTEFGKLVLEEGNELKIVNSTFILFPYTGLFN